MAMEPTDEFGFAATCKPTPSIVVLILSVDGVVDAFNTPLDERGALRVAQRVPLGKRNFCDSHIRCQRRPLLPPQRPIHRALDDVEVNRHPMAADERGHMVWPDNVALLHIADRFLEKGGRALQSHAQLFGAPDTRVVQVLQSRSVLEPVFPACRAECGILALCLTSLLAVRATIRGVRSADLAQQGPSLRRQARRRSCSNEVP
mmetsp:Transcript_57830/g.161411  ORF Transcript_57830/g.161411 Transcript_57830/m.161411 type:complete len:204 (-) Transcript_57830:1577-2188(-)